MTPFYRHNIYRSPTLHALDSRFVICSFLATGYNLCLHAITIALHEACSGQPSYLPTKNLQLASLEFCSMCRAVSTLHMRVDEHTPPGLWATPFEQRSTPPTIDSKRSGDDGAARNTIRVPLLRARGVIWTETASSKFMSSKSNALSYLQYVEFAPGTVRDLTTVVWPHGVRTIVFDDGNNGELSRFNLPIERVAWPAGLQYLTFGYAFNHRVDRALWSTSLQRLTFGHAFDQPVDGVVWPLSLQQLTFGHAFNQPIEAVAWPSSLQQLTFGSSFNQPVEGVTWPVSLQQLAFGSRFNQPIEGVSWPPSLQHLTFRICFNQSIQRVVWPASLRQLIFGQTFNQPIEGVMWPVALQQLVFGYFFNQPIKGVEWPASLQRIAFGPVFKQPIQDVAWPPALEQLGYWP